MLLLFSQNAANTISNFFNELTKQQPEVKNNAINVLLATQGLELFAFEYGRIHHKAKEHKVISKQHYGEWKAITDCIAMTRSGTPYISSHIEFFKIDKTTQKTLLWRLV